MITAICRLYYSLLISLILVSSCSAEIPQAPTNQLIKGPFTITTEWQTIAFDKPLKTLPHIQFLELLLDRELYEPIENIEEDEFHIIGSSYKRIGENQPIRAAIILIDKQGREFRALLGGSGFRKTELGVYGNLSYGTNADQGKFIYPYRAEFVAIKIRSNIKIRVEHLAWYAPYFYQAPNAMWDDISESEIILLK